VIGLVMLAMYGFVRLHAQFFQVYDSWSFDQSMKTHSNTRNSNGTEAEPNDEESAISRIDKFKKDLARPNSNIVGRLLIPSLGLNVMVLEGTDGWTLNRSLGHIENTALPGKPGNVGISGHRDSFFRNLGSIRQGDEIALVTTESTYTYEVESTAVVMPRDTWVLAAGATPSLTLVTCYPFHYIGKAPERFIVKARMRHSPPPNTGLQDNARDFLSISYLWNTQHLSDLNVIWIAQNAPIGFEDPPIETAISVISLCNL